MNTPLFVCSHHNLENVLPWFQKECFDCLLSVSASSWIQVGWLPLTIISNHMVLTWEHDHLERMVWVDVERRIIVLRVAHMWVGHLFLLLLGCLPFQPQLFSHTCPNTEAIWWEKFDRQSYESKVPTFTRHIFVQGSGSEAKHMGCGVWCWKVSAINLAKPDFFFGFSDQWSIFSLRLCNMYFSLCH